MRSPLFLRPTQIVLPPELEEFVQRQLASGKYQTEIEVLVAGAKLLEQQEDIYQGRLQALQQEALIGWQAVQWGEIRTAPQQWHKFAPTCILVMLPSHDGKISSHRTCNSRY